MGILYIARNSYCNYNYNKALLIINRCFSLNISPDMNKYESREAKFMNKLMGVSNKKRKYFFDNGPLPGNGDLKLTNKFNNSKENYKRLTVLNSLFMKHISDLLVTGGMIEDVLQKGLDITRVSISPNFQQLNVFWGTSNEENESYLSDVLPGIGFKLRHKLSQLGLMGVVPRITFVKEKQYNSGAKIDYLLSIADYGEDYVPAELPSELISEPMVQTIPVSHLQENCEKSDKTSDEVPSEQLVVPQDTMPVMRQDVLNLDHDAIMKRIEVSMEKSKAVHRYLPNLAVYSEGNKNKPKQLIDVDDLTKEQRKEAMDKFILNRKILKEKRYQNKLQAALNLPYLQNNESDDSYECEDFQVEDYIDEELFEDKKYI